MNYELSSERWSPVQSVEKILLSVVSMLAGKEYFSLINTIAFYACTNGQMVVVSMK